MDKKMHVSSLSKKVFINTHPLHPIEGYQDTLHHNTNVQLIINLIIYSEVVPRLKSDLASTDKLFAHGWGVRVNINIDHTLFDQGYNNLQSVIIVIDSGNLQIEKLSSLINLIKTKNSNAQIFIEITELDNVIKIQKLEFNGLVVSGNDSGLIYSESSSFILFQKIKLLVKDKMILVKGGIGKFSSVGFLLAGADAVILESELYAFSELKLSSVCYDLINKKNPKDKNKKYIGFERLEEISNRVITGKIKIQDELSCIGNESLLARYLIQERGVNQLISSIYSYFDEAVAILTGDYPISENSELSNRLGSKLPIVQGPMAWVSDNYEFAKDISNKGGFPVFATGTMEIDEIKKLLNKVRNKFKYGVGLIGFENYELMEAQIQTLIHYEPEAVILAGGSPSQTEMCRKYFKNVFVHVPSPRLINAFVDSGHKQLIFEGSESGGHVASLSSQLLWESSIHELLQKSSKLGDMSLLAAGGLSGEISSVFVSGVFATLIEKGVSIGLQLGTAYLATKEASNNGIISEDYNKQVALNNKTLVLGTPVGHRVRVTETEMSKSMLNDEIAYIDGNLSQDELKKSIEYRVTRSRDIQRSKEKDQLSKCLFMSGDIAGYFGSDFTISKLHKHLTEDSRKLLLNSIEKDLEIYTFLLTAHSQRECISRIETFLNFSSRYSLKNLHDYSLFNYKSTKVYKLGFVFKTKRELIQKLKYSLDNIVNSDIAIYKKGIAYTAGQSKANTKIAFMFPGQGSHYKSMFSDLMRKYPYIRDILNRKIDYYKDKYGIDPWKEMNQDGQLTQEWHAQPLIWSFESTLLEVLKSIEAEFDYAIGHSLGEIAAFESLGIVNAEVISEAVYNRGLLMKDMCNTGGMTVVFCDEKKVESIINTVGGSTEIANVNALNQIVVSATIEDLCRLEKVLEKINIAFYRLKVSYPFHSKILKDLSDQYYQYCEDNMKLIDDHDLNPEILKKVISNLTSLDYKSSFDALERFLPNVKRKELVKQVISRLLSEQITNKVKFKQGIQNLYNSDVRVFLELGPGNTLCGLVNNIIKQDDVIVESVLDRNNEVESFNKLLLLLGVFGNIKYSDDKLSNQLDSAGVRRIELLLEEDIQKNKIKRLCKHSYINDNDIAIVSVALKGPGAVNENEYWKNILDKKCSIDEIPDDKWITSDFYDPDIEAVDKTYGNVAGVTNFDISDSIKYGFQPKAANEIDRMQIVALQLVDDLVHKMGYEPNIFPFKDTSVVIGYAYPEKTTGQYAGRLYYEHLKTKFEESYKKGSISKDVYNSILNQFQEEESLLPNYSSTAAVACLSNMISARIARYLDIDQPNFVVDSACATSLSAIDVASMQLRSNKCSYAITGGLDDFSAGRQVGFARTFALSIKGSCTPFDEKADGLIQGDGAGLIMLTTVKTARENNNKILGIIKGIGGSSDGKTSRNLVTPSFKRQALSIKRALNEASWSSEDVDYIEAHGTGTVLGDHAEMRSIKEHFSGLTEKSIPVGSVKANVGHTMIAAGTFSLVKVIKAINSGLIPPQIGIDTINPRLNIQDSPLYFPSKTEVWLRRDENTPRRALICSYGFGGTNHHMAVEEYIEPQTLNKEYIYGLSENNIEALIAKLTELKYHEIGVKSSNKRFRLGFISYGYAKFNALKNNIIQSLHKLNKSEIGINYKLLPGVYISDTSQGPKQKKIAIIFPGHGSQYKTMGIDMYSKSRTFREVVDIKLNAYGDVGTSMLQNIEKHGSFIEEDNQSLTTYIAISTINLAYRRLLDIIMPGKVAYAGYSLGEYSALVSSGVISYTDSIKIENFVINAFIENTVNLSGWMSMIILDDDELDNYIKKYSYCINVAMKICPSVNVITGLSREMEQIEQDIKNNSNGIIKRIPSLLPYHWHGLHDVYTDIRNKIDDGIEVSLPVSDIYTCVSQSNYNSSESIIKDTCASITTTTLDISNQIKNLHEDGYNIFVESGPGSTYTNMIQSNIPDNKYWALSVDDNSDSKWSWFADSVCRLYALGVDIDNNGLIQILDKKPKETIPDSLNITNLGNKMNDNFNKIIMELIKSNESISRDALKANREILDILSGKVVTNNNHNLDEMINSKKTEELSQPPTDDSENIDGDYKVSLLNDTKDSIKIDVNTDKSQKTATEKQDNINSSEPIVVSNFKQSTKNTICGIIKKHSGFEDDHLFDTASLQDDLGIDSIQQMLIIGDINKELGIDLMKVISWDEPPSKLHELYVLVDSVA
jgi:acyl transferase domain-containing protein/NAD(P)H-dependent flavin oxidoreductase YrpB (nitropropane dioxygenase family)/acyl carrier protein